MVEATPASFRSTPVGEDESLSRSHRRTKPSYSQPPTGPPPSPEDGEDLDPSQTSYPPPPSVLLDIDLGDGTRGDIRIDLASDALVSKWGIGVGVGSLDVLV